MANILVFGDSITQGFWDIEGGWVSRLRRFLDQKTLESKSETYFSIFNLGISGDTSEGLAKRFEAELKPRLDQEAEAIIIFAIGINDSYYINPENRHNVSLEQFQQNLWTLLSQARKYSKKIAFLGLTPIDQAKTDPVPWSWTKSYKNDYIKTYNDALKEFCHKNNTDFISLLNQLNSLQDLEDGLHPNSTGHEKIYKIVKSYLLNDQIQI